MDQLIQYSPSEFVDIFNQSTEYAFPVVVIEGEISSFRIAKGRWVYFDIKDEVATLRCFGTVYMLPGPLEDGMMVRIVCSPRLHPQFNFSLNIQSIVPVGEGALAKQAELLYKKLEAEGIFASEKKRLVAHPATKVALITSVESAAYADYVKVTKARWPHMQIDAYDVHVQGASAPAQIAARILEINQSSDVYDAIVIIRGGGSVEDLSAFNDERVVRAISASRLPTCVAIGHEVDESLSELACDLRASTPSNLAELMTPDRQAELMWLKSSSGHLATALAGSIIAAKNDLIQARERLSFMLEQMLRAERESLRYATEKLSLLNPKEVLKRGYGIIRDSQNRVVKYGSLLEVGEEIAIIFTDTTRKAKLQ